jgi:hypothetical protein
MSNLDKKTIKGRITSVRSGEKQIVEVIHMDT